MNDTAWPAQGAAQMRVVTRPPARLLTLLAVLIAAVGTGEELRAQGSGAPGESLEGELQRIRDATRAFRDITAAHEAGYPTEVPPCVENPPEGGMGHHYTHPGLMDARLDIERPEILVYAPTDGGELRLAGVEYVVPYSARKPDGPPPRVLGQDLKRSGQLRLWYLHVWVWEENPDGLFADWNPAVRCDPAAGSLR